MTLVVLFLAVVIILLSALVNLVLQLRSRDNIIKWGKLLLTPFLIGACVAAVVLIGELLEAGAVRRADLMFAAGSFAILAFSLLIGGLIGRPAGWALKGLFRRQ